MASSKFERLIRFVSSSGDIYFGEVPKDHPYNQSLIGIEAPVYQGASPFDPDFKLSGENSEVKKLLSPLVDVPFIYGVGLNYRRHAEEAGVPIPQHPKTFVKYPDAMTGPYDDVHLHSAALDVDYEGELVFVMGENVKDIAEDADPLLHVLGYTIGNDISSRWWQEAAKGGQSNYAKSFDGFAPLGPVLVSSKLIPDPAKLTLRTWVNNEKRQESGIDDLIFDVPAIVRFFSQGRTLRKGAVVMTGTPSGVGSFQKGGPKFLKHGDVVEIEIEGIGRVKNRIIQ
ncbi:fumarylacetoacetate hydrolase family protein [Paecilomyces variotii]|uniref:Fumarylacetoacetate hydrolase family protein n=1 Tax=Byssochlamys spectabilis TaxID=264951 RepID=A0A443HRA6_BYSSP|nr:fumarylacetoacetate hydrolase family protein [Paecilomyces variotii]KAJ9365693.1 hypothetical protein DTO280E4_662 [Paecilomyces variotii]RWQ94337.1 fumarylacetoacetate hydrolase family protein [Paecilomyces variotii]